MSKEYPEWVRQKAADLCDVDLRHKLWNPQDFDDINSLTRAFLKLIEEHYPAPVDEDLILARKVVADQNKGFPCWASEVLSGCMDKHAEVRVALAAIKAVRGQATEQESTA